MREEKQGDLFDPEGDVQGGAFDDQLSLPLPFVEAPTPFQTIVKRDGRREPFVRRKIANAIFRAAQSVGGQDYDLAENLASAVTIYLVKRLGDRPPTVDHVHDAVERVLIQMSHAKTALAYARYRDRRARVRRLREGDMRALLSELDEARHEREALAGRSADALFIRTSTDTLTTWDRQKIVDALVRETGIEGPDASLIAFEVEQQIEQAQIKTLTTSLVRELVGAKLVEHGLEEYRERHRRLGVPLYDTERIVRGATPESLGQGPVGTGRLLARAVKKEYALAEVFSPPVAEAHLRGDIHIHHLNQVDRLHSASHSLDYVSRHGVDLPGARNFAAPAKHAATLLAHMIKSTEIYEGFFAEAANWHAVNVFFAPFVYGWDEVQLGQFAQMLVYEYAYRTLAQDGNTAANEVTCSWTVPESLRHREAVEPSGIPTGKTYGQYQHTAQQLAWALTSVLQEGGVNGETFPAPLLAVSVGPDFFKAAGHERFLDHAARAAALRRNVHFVLDRKPGEKPGRVAALRNHDGSPCCAALHQVTLNLARAAYTTGTEPALLEELGRLLALAATAHEEKRDFIESLHDGAGNGPLGLLSCRRDGRPYLDLDETLCLVAIEGLNECVQVLLNAELHESGEAMALGHRILGCLSRQARELSGQRPLRIVLAQNNDPMVSRRFATLDAQAYPETAATTLKTDPETQALQYTSGARLRTSHELNPIEHARLEGEFHPYLVAGAVSAVRLPLSHASHESIADFITKAYRQTVNQRILFV